MRTSAEIAWAAGLFEGEGSVYVSCRGDRLPARRQRIGMTLRMTDKDVVERFSEVVDCGHFSGPILYDGKKDVYEWRSHSWSTIKRLYELFKPWLFHRRKCQFETSLAETKPELLCKAERLPPDCGYLRQDEISKRGERHHKKVGTPLCLHCWKSQLAYERQHKSKENQ